MLRPDTFALTALLALLTALGPLSTDMYLPSFPDIVGLLDASPAQVQLTLSVYLACFALSQIVFGPIADRYGRKPVVMVALVIYGIGSLMCAAAPSIVALIAARCVQAVGAAGAIVLARAIVRDLYHGARAGRELSLMGAVMALAPIVAPLIGGVLDIHYGWRASFFVIAAVGAIMVVAIWRLLPETLKLRAPEPVSFAGTAESFAELLRHGAFAVHLGIVSLSFAGLFAWVSGSSYVLQRHYGLSELQFGLAFALAATGFLTGTMLAARIVRRAGLDRTIGLGAAALASGGLGMALSAALDLPSALAMVGPMVLYMAGVGMTMPQAMAAALTPFPERAGAASSLLGCSQMLTGAAVGIAVGRALAAGPWSIAAATALLGTATLILWALSRQVRLRPT